jgi:hypothetical protein
VFGGWWTLGTLAALVVERAPDVLVSRDLDRISAVHLLVAALAFGFWQLVWMFPTVSGWQRRALSTAGAGLVTGTLLWLLVPGFAAGPFGDVPPELWDAWLSSVAELQPLWPFGSNPARTVYLLAAPVLAVPIVVAAMRGDRSHRSAWLSLGVAMVGLIALGLFQARFTAFAQLLAAVAWGWLSARLVARVGAARRPGDPVRRVAAMLTGVAGFLVPVILVTVLASEPVVEASVPTECVVDDLFALIEERGDAPVVLTHVDWGPEILYRTEASVLASPYHRNVDGILDARRFLSSTPEVSLAIAVERSVDMVAVCPDRDAGYLGSERNGGDLLELLTAGRPPEWLRAQTTDSDLLVYEVIREAG